jgi:hypothetical protein
MTGAFRTIPTAALEVAIGEARDSYFRIGRFGNVTQRGNIAYLNFSRDTVVENIFNTRTDTVIPRYSFAKAFTVTDCKHSKALMEGPQQGRAIKLLNMIRQQLSV